MPDPTYIALSNRHTLITRREENIWSCRIKQLLRSSYRMRGNRGSNGWGHIFFRHGQPFSMFSKVDQTGTLSWLTDKTQQFRVIDTYWRLMSHKTAYVGKRLCCCCCCCTNESSLKPSWLSRKFCQATLSFASNSLIVIFYILGISLQDIMLISLTDRFPDLFPFGKGSVFVIQHHQIYCIHHCVLCMYTILENHVFWHVCVNKNTWSHAWFEKEKKDQSSCSPVRAQNPGLTK